MNWLQRVFGSSRRVTVKSPLELKSPKIGFLNLLGSTGRSLLEEDKAALGPIFPASEVSDTAMPQCDVLLIYAQAGSDGRLIGSEDGLRGLIRKANAVIAILASPNEPNNLIAAGYGQANLVLTINRKGPAFARFFAELFRKMYRGTTMPVAWVEPAPQNPRAQHENCPETIFLAEVSHIVFQ